MPPQRTSDGDARPRRISLAVDDPSVSAVSAVVYPATRRRAAPVLLFPGAGGDLDDVGLTALAELLAARGHAVVRANLPYREAGRRAAPRADRSVPAVRRILAAATAELGTARRWILGGKSYGGRVASMAVADGADALGLLFYGYPLHPPGKPERLRVEHWHRIEVPCLFLQGDRDPFCGIDLLEDNVRKLPRRPTVHVVAGGDHSLRVTAAASPTGTPAGPAATIRALDEPISTWVHSLTEG